MEHTLAKLFATGMLAYGAALIIYGLISSFADGETIREFAELNSLIIATAMGAVSLVRG